MAVVAQEPHASPRAGPANLNLNINSNNPFRNRMSAASPSPRSPEPTQQNFPFPAMSNNPFLDPSERAAPLPPPPGVAVTTNGEGVAMADDIFKDLSLLDKPADKPVGNGTASSRGPPPPRPANGAPPGRPMGPPSERRPGPPRGPPRGLGDSPQKRPEHRRRASETSVMDIDKERERQHRRERERERGERAPRTESEERRRRQRRKEREERYKREGRDPKSGGRKQRNLDLIDKLDVTGIYGEGLFHHDGPFDACNPHRNAKKDRRAPMQAFPEGSANMMLGGSGPLRSRLDLDKFHGRGEEGFQDYAVTRKRTNNVAAQQYINPTDRIEQVHGEESYGLGTSTFLEGAPASKKALERRESEEQTQPDGMPPVGGGGLQRKKSLAQRLRGMSASQRRGAGAPGELRSPEARYNNDGATSPPLMQSQSAGGRAQAAQGYTRDNEVNVFDNEYDAAFEKKGTQIRIAERDRPGASFHARAPSSPRGGGAGLTRSVTADAAAASPGGEEKPAGGFLNRMKSLKGGRRARPERKDSNP